MPGLKGKQANIDVARPFGRITAADFKLLNKMKQKNGKGATKPAAKNKKGLRIIYLPLLPCHLVAYLMAHFEI